MLTYFDEFLGAFWKFLLEGGPFLLLGLFIAGLIRAFVHTAQMARWLGPNTVGSAFKAALIGAPLPLCSCSVIPAALTLRKQGASKAATQSFLITAPETGVDSIALTYAFLGVTMAIIRPLAAIVTGLAAGILEMCCGTKESCGCGGNHLPAGATAPPADTFSDGPEARVPSDHDHPHSPACGCSHESAAPACCASASPVSQPSSTGWFARFLEGQRYAFGPMLQDLAGWMLLGLMVAAVIQVALPADVISTGTARFGLANWMWYLVMAAIGVPMYICASMATPVMAALILKGLSPGAALVFLLAGPATNVSTMGLIRKHLGTRSLTLYLAAILLGAFGFGVLVDVLAFGWPLLFVPDISRSAGGLIPTLVAFPLAVLTLVLLVQGWLLERLAQFGRKIHPGEAVPDKLTRPLQLGVWGLAGMVVITAWMQGLFLTPLNAGAVEALVSRYNATPRPSGPAPTLPAGLNEIQAPPVPLALADLTALSQAAGPDGRPLIYAYQRRMLDLAGFFRADERPTQIALPGGRSASGTAITLFPTPDGSAGRTVEFLPDRWPKLERTSGVVRVTARLLVEEDRTGQPVLRLFGNDFHPFRPADAADLGLLSTEAPTGRPAFRSAPLPLEEIEKLAAAHQGEAVPLPAEIQRLIGQRVRLDGYYVFSWQDPDGSTTPLVGRHYFDGVCCGVFPGPFNSVLVRLASARQTAALAGNAANPLAGLRYGQKLSVEGVLSLPAELPADVKEPPIVLHEAQVARPSEPGLGDVRWTVLLGLGLLLLFSRTAKQTWRKPP